MINFFKPVTSTSSPCFWPNSPSLCFFEFSEIHLKFLIFGCGFCLRWMLLDLVKRCPISQLDWSQFDQGWIFLWLSNFSFSSVPTGLSPVLCLQSASIVTNLQELLPLWGVNGSTDFPVFETLSCGTLFCNVRLSNFQPPPELSVLLVYVFIQS